MRKDLGVVISGYWWVRSEIESGNLINGEDLMNTRRWWTLTLFVLGVALLAAPWAEAQVWRKNRLVGWGPLTPNPYNESTIYSGAVGGFAISRDYGSTWTRFNLELKTNGYFNGATLGLAVMPDDTNAIVLIPGSIGPLSGLARTTDGGETWIMDTTYEDWGAGYVNTADGVFYDLDDPGTFYVVEALMNRVLLRSSDHGASYDTVAHFDSLGYGRIDWLCAGTMHPVTKEIYVGGWHGVLWRSKDKGKSWTSAYMTSLKKNDTAGYQLKVQSIKFCTKQPNIGFATMTQRDAYDSIPGTRVGGLYKTTDYGETWKLIAFGGHSMWALDVKEDDTGAIHVATGSVGNPLDDVVAYSSDGGTSWTEYKDDVIPWTYQRRSSLDIIITMKNSPFYDQKRLLLSTDEGFFYLDPFGVSATPEPVTSADTPIRIHRSNDVLVARVRSELPLEHPVVRVYDISGGTVHSSVPDITRFAEDDYEFHMPAMNAGAYYLVVSSGAQTYTVPFVLD